jgi:predicted amidohydrolase
MAFNRNQFINAPSLGDLAVATPSTSPQDATSGHSLRLALLHLAPIPGDMAYNRRLVEKAVGVAAGMGATWIITPELCVCGYAFANRIGTDWILPQPDSWMSEFCRLVAQLRVTVFLSHPERDAQSTKLHNSVFVISENGEILGKHRKINTLRVGSESWSSPGELANPIQVSPQHKVGLLICADACSIGIAKSLQAQGAQILISSAAWCPGLYGPSGEWEQCTRSTGLPLVVCNRTGRDESLDFSEAESVVVKDGQRLLSFHSPGSAIFSLEWDVQMQGLASSTPTIHLLT